jgi:hypothetical protein
LGVSNCTFYECESKDRVGFGKAPLLETREKWGTRRVG